MHSNLPSKTESKFLIFYIIKLKPNRNFCNSSVSLKPFFRFLGFLHTLTPHHFHQLTFNKAKVYFGWNPPAWPREKNLVAILQIIILYFIFFNVYLKTIFCFVLEINFFLKALLLLISSIL